MADKPSWYRIHAEGDGAAVVYLYGVVGQDWWGEGNSALDFARELDALSPRAIELRVNSEGGDFFEGTAIHAALSRYPGTVTAFVDGLAASAASFLIRAADEVVMGEMAFQMIHNAWTFALGNAEELASVIDTLNAIDEQMVGVYSQASTKDADEIRAAMAATTWLTAEQAIEWGLADRIEESLKAAACVSEKFAAKFGGVPEGVVVGDATPTIEASEQEEPVSDAVGQGAEAEDEPQEGQVAQVRYFPTLGCSSATTTPRKE